VATRQALVGDGIVPLMLQALREAARKMQAATR
jgi:hypothetical protein